jgi:hypothetical protein
MCTDALLLLHALLVNLGTCMSVACPCILVLSPVNCNQKVTTVAACHLHTCVSLTGCALQMRPSVQELLCMPYVSQYIQKYAEHIMQLPDDTGRAPSLNLDQLPIIKQIRR